MPRPRSMSTGRATSRLRGSWLFGSAPALEELVRNAELIEHFTDRVRDDIVYAPRIGVHRRHRREDNCAHLRQLRERPEMTEVQRRLANDQDQAPLLF